MAQTDSIGDEVLSTILLGERTVGWGTEAEKPTSNYHANGWYLATDSGRIYQNTGTEATPVWTQRIETGNLVWGLLL